MPFLTIFRLLADDVEAGSLPCSSELPPSTLNSVVLPQVQTLPVANAGPFAVSVVFLSCFGAFC